MVIGELCDTQGEIKFEWKIRNFFRLSNRVGTKYESSEFSFCGVSWEIWIYPNGYAGDRTIGWISLLLAPTSLTSPITVDYSFHLKTVDGKTDTCSGPGGTITHDFDEEESGYGFLRFIQRKKLFKRKAELLPSGNLTVICTLKKSNTTGEAAGGDTVDEFTQTEEESGNVSTAAFTQSKEWVGGSATIDEFTQTEEGFGSDTVIDEFTQKKTGIEFTKDLSECKILQDFKELYLNQTDCDVIIKVKGREFPAHQAFLKARSPVLCSTFQIDMKEKATGVVNIDDCDPSAFSDFLCFLYCGDVENLSAENVFNLFTIADKYDVNDLRSQCLKFIKENLTVDTFCDTISLALLHSEDDLIKLSNNFFAKNVPNIIVTLKWQLFLAENPTVSNELLIKALTSNKNSDV